MQARDAGVPATLTGEVGVLLDVDATDGPDEPSCRTSMVRARNRILDEAQRLALAR